MNHSETLRILSVLRAAYPAFYKDMGRETLDGIVALWQSMLADMPYGVVNAAIRALIPGEEDRVARRLQIQVDLWEKAKQVISEDARNPDVDLV